MTVVWIISATLLLAAAALTAYRTLRGPTTVDRLVGVDALVAIAICGLSVWVAYTADTTVVPGIVALSLVGFIGSVSVARFRVRDNQL
ncbi:monovalent cation/H+ antiporter complex subunit F [Gordonia sp. (in: high G+C Gram-positive bacteria)]|uniref:monovalent cation/H+ antiporter complex subunit F n=1 Tax=Gordonia sp. (in: high G+C Gram-positive bacteria) TaxID=84139 RepID=UPI0016A11E2F|nr:monovalent cation/H+ antiporter complex subunit F [Gordonia sp. (in: high G+C Gram-positive bacteria)]NLG47237.1 cation:proton antiporter [Gordonia sp. (in: high G+C Gram-positive bacteria)]